MNSCHTVDLYIPENRSVYLDIEDLYAHIEHKCSECGRIVINEEYRREILLNQNDRIFVHKLCDDCLSIREVFFSSGWYFGELINDLKRFVGDCNGSVSEHQLSMVTKRAKNMICNFMDHETSKY